MINNAYLVNVFDLLVAASSRSLGFSDIQQNVGLTVSQNMARSIFASYFEDSLACYACLCTSNTGVLQVEDVSSPPGKYPHLGGGLTAIINSALPAGQRVVSLQYNCGNITDTDSLHLVTNDFLGRTLSPLPFLPLSVACLQRVLTACLLLVASALLFGVSDFGCMISTREFMGNGCM